MVGHTLKLNDYVYARLVPVGCVSSRRVKCLPLPMPARSGYSSSSCSQPQGPRVDGPSGARALDSLLISDATQTEHTVTQDSYHSLSIQVSPRPPLGPTPYVTTRRMYVRVCVVRAHIPNFEHAP